MDLRKLTRNHLVLTLLIGWTFALLVEIINMGVRQGLWLGAVLTVLIFYSIFIFAGLWYVKKISKDPLRHFVNFGSIGLIIEWTVFGMVPWGGGNPLVIALIQTGMFSHWATTTFGPRFLLDPDPRVARMKNSFVLFYMISMGTVYALGLVMPGHARPTVMILGNVIVYTILLYWYAKYILLKRKPVHPGAPSNLRPVRPAQKKKRSDQGKRPPPTPRSP